MANVHVVINKTKSREQTMQSNKIIVFKNTHHVEFPVFLFNDQINQIINNRPSQNSSIFPNVSSS